VGSGSAVATVGLLGATAFSVAAGKTLVWGGTLPFTSMNPKIITITNEPITTGTDNFAFSLMCFLDKGYALQFISKENIAQVVPAQL
jgi:hypothetical protein